MPLKADLVQRKLLSIEQAVGRLRADLLLQWAVERGLQIAAEALFDAGSHVLAAAFQEAVDEYREIPPRLAARGVLSPETAARLQSLSGLRNVLVHDYADVELGHVARGAARLEDFEAFVTDVSEWLDRQRATGQ